MLQQIMEIKYEIVHTIRLYPLIWFIQKNNDFANQLTRIQTLVLRWLT